MHCRSLAVREWPFVDTNDHHVPAVEHLELTHEPFFRIIGEMHGGTTLRYDHQADQAWMTGLE